ncbi:MAG: hypothetical protein ACK443_02480 [Methylococcaceae bacterium]|jgi:hypothetical protein
MTTNKPLKTTTLPIKTGLYALTIVLTGIVASGCDSGSSKSANPAMSAEAKIEGNVQDVHGPIMEGKLEVQDKSGKVITSLQFDGKTSHYNLSVPAGTNYPIVLVATPPAGSNSDIVKAVVTSPLADRIDVTDVTTLIVNAAIAMGGLTDENIAKASGGAIGMRQRQGVSAASGGGGAGAGQSGGGVGHGGHGGHDMSKMGGGSPDAAKDNSQMQNMQH